VAICKTKEFRRWARKQNITDAVLLDAVSEMRSGLYEANLGSGLFKKRIARPGHGKSAGFRTLVATNKGNRWFFLYGFAKNDRANIDQTEEIALKKLASVLLSMAQHNLAKAQIEGELYEVEENG
jgi:hypothetical protein